MLYSLTSLLNSQIIHPTEYQENLTLNQSGLEEHHGKWVITDVGQGSQLGSVERVKEKTAMRTSAGQ